MFCGFKILSIGEQSVAKFARTLAPRHKIQNKLNFENCLTIRICSAALIPVLREPKLNTVVKLMYSQVQVPIQVH